MMKEQRNKNEINKACEGADFVKRMAGIQYEFGWNFVDECMWLCADFYVCLSVGKYGLCADFYVCLSAGNYRVCVLIFMYV